MPVNNHITGTSHRNHNHAKPRQDDDDNGLEGWEA